MNLRGALSRWLLEPKAGVYLGNPSARVRDELWKRAVLAQKGGGSVLQLWTDKNPQGFSYRQTGNSDRTFVEFEGLMLVSVRKQKSPPEPQNADTTEALSDSDA